MDEMLLFIDFCFNIATILRVFGSSVEYLWTILGNEVCLRDWCLYIEDVDLVINEQYGQPYRFGSINDCGLDDDGIFIVSFIFCIYCDIDPNERKKKILIRNLFFLTIYRLQYLNVYVSYVLHNHVDIYTFIIKK